MLAGVRQKFLNIDEYYHSIPNKILLNNYSLYDTEKSNECFRMLINTYKSDVISTIPTCVCGKTSGTWVQGMNCKSCGFKVDDKGYDPIVWIKTFSDEFKFINPFFYTLLDEELKNITPYLMGIEDEFKSINSALLGKSIEANVLGGVRTYANFVKNIRNILEFVNGLPKYKSMHSKCDELIELYDKYEKDIFGEYLPLISPMLFNITKTNKGKFVDFKLSDVVDIASDWLRYGTTEPTPKQINRLIGSTYKKLGQLVVFIIKDYLASKTGFFRKHLNGAKSPFTFRCVIVSRPGKHRHDEIEVPWVTGTSVFRPHILNKLDKRGYTYLEAKRLIDSASKRYDPVIDEILNELIKECPYRGIPVIIQRNPSLLQGSAQLVYITEFKKDPGDNTVGFSQLIVKAPNGDYDGMARVG